MTDTSTPAAPEPPAPAPHHHPVIPRPQTDADALRAIDRVKSEMHERAEEIRRAPQDHQPKLVLSEHVRGTSLLDKIADAVNRICGSMWVFIGITLGIVVWLFLGNVVGFDKTPWPLLLTILNLPQLSIMISLQVSANRAQAASDRRALADHETLIALHAMATQQLDLLNGQTKVLAILDNFASKDMPGRQQQIQYTVNKILTAVSPAVSLARAIVAIRQLSARLSRRGYEDERERGGRRRRAERQRAAASRERPRQRRRGQGL
ncbi:MAG: hypothetical protein ABSA02_15315 [Trebonia sp.]|jgi:uncharacterized membrane protein